MRRFFLAVAAVVLVGCQHAPSPGPVSQTQTPPAAELRAEGDALLVQGQYWAAAEKYTRALEHTPADVALRFALGTAYSFLERRAEAIQQFHWVMSQGDPGSTEYREARRWLARVGALVETTRAAVGSPETPPRPEIEPSKGRILGRTEWPGVSPRQRLFKGDMVLEGDEEATRGVKRMRPFRVGDSYEFRDLPPGKYRLIASVDDVNLWDQKVAIEPDKLTEVVLTQASSPVSPAKFPPPEPK
jgi:tetratricopeptide (TPR) repeat protein